VQSYYYSPIIKFGWVTAAKKMNAGQIPADGSFFHLITCMRFADQMYIAVLVRRNYDQKYILNRVLVKSQETKELHENYPSNTLRC
jgi:hypothetical protein